MSTTTWAAMPRRTARHAASATRLVWGAVLFNFVLCFAKTMGAPIALSTVAGVQLLILAAAAALAWDDLVPAAGRACLVALGVIGVLFLVNPALSPKIAMDLAIPLVFYWLGRRHGGLELGNRLILLIAACVLAVGLFEMFALTTFERAFNIFAYFLDKGALSASQAGDTGTTLAENGMRAAGDGRQLFPALGLHRVGSVFLEPISAGNFAVICVVWCLSARPSLPRSLPWLLAIAAGIGILADARFSVFTSAAVIACLMTPLWRSRLPVAVLPFACVAALLGFVAFAGAAHVDNTVAGRLASSGLLLASWDWRNWLALIPAGDGTFDSGYGYLFSNFGLIPAGCVWLAFALRKPANAAAARYSLGLALYMSLSLCISGSSLSIKTAALLWFLLGCLDKADPKVASA